MRDSWTSFTEDSADHPHSATIPLIFLFFFFYDIAYTPMLVAYTLEILPYKIRARGFAVMVRTFGIFTVACVADLV